MTVVIFAQLVQLDRYFPKGFRCWNVLYSKVSAFVPNTRPSVNYHLISPTSLFNEIKTYSTTEYFLKSIRILFTKKVFEYIFWQSIRVRVLNTRKSILNTVFRILLLEYAHHSRTDCTLFQLQYVVCNLNLSLTLQALESLPPKFRGGGKMHYKILFKI